MHWLKRFLRLEPQDLQVADPRLWQQSVLRIILCSGLALVLGIVLHSSWQAWQQGLYHIIVITSSFYVSLIAALFVSMRKPKLAAAALLLTVIGAGVCMLLFIQDFAFAKLGVIFVYPLPMISLMFFGLRTAIGFMLFNFIPFGYLLSGNQPPDLGLWS